MGSAWVGHLIELASLPLFLWCWLELRARRRSEHMELLVTVLYGWLLETLDMWIFGTYRYQEATWWWVGHVPLYIPLLWAVIIHSSMELSDRSGLPRWARPFLDGLLAVLIDLAIDAIAIRLKLWFWGIPLNQGWFGVPAGNLCAWMWVAAWYGATMRLVRERIEMGEPRWHRLLVPVTAYVGLFSSLFLIGATGQLLGWTDQNQRLWIFAGHVAVFLGIVVAAMRQRSRVLPDAPPVPASFVWNRWLMHASFLTLLLVTGVWQHAHVLVAVSLTAMAVEWLVQLATAVGGGASR